MDAKQSKDNNPAAVLYGVKDVRFENRPCRDLREREVLVRMHSVGICGSDVHYWEHGKIGRFVLQKPMVMGHEASGIVVDTHPSVKKLQIGDRVAIEPGVPCRKCDLCKEGKYNLCYRMEFCATPPIDGNMCKYFVHPEDFCHKLPDNCTLEEGALVEPLSVALHSCQKAKVGMGSRVLVLGAGPIGLLTLLVAKAMGSSTVVITDIDDKRLGFATDLGADGIVNVAKESRSNLLDRIAYLFGGQGANSVIECSGAQDSLDLGCLAAAPRAVIATVGRGSYCMNLKVDQVMWKELEIRGIFRYTNCYSKAISMLPVINARRLVTKTVAFDDVETALCLAKGGREMKIIVLAPEVALTDRQNSP